MSEDEKGKQKLWEKYNIPHKDYQPISYGEFLEEVEEELSLTSEESKKKEEKKRRIQELLSNLSKIEKRLLSVEASYYKRKAQVERQRRLREKEKGSVVARVQKGDLGKHHVEDLTTPFKKRIVEDPDGKGASES